MITLEMEHDTKTQSATTYTVPVKGARIFVHDSGQGAPILFLHGSPDTHDMWLPAIAQFDNKFRSIAIDLPGFGQSTMPASFSLSLDDMADFVRELVIGLSIDEPVTLVTTDFGGHYGLAFTTKYPDMVRGIAISNTNFFSDYNWHFFARLYRLPVIGDLLVATASRDMMRKTLKSVAPDMPDSYIDSSYDTGFGSTSVRKTILRMYRERQSSDFAGWEEKLLAILHEKPAIVLWGDKDPFITPDYADRFGKAQVQHFENFSHWLPLEAPEQYAAVLMTWLNSID